MKTTNRTPRYLAIDILHRWEKSRRPVDQIIEGQLAGKVLADSRDRQLIHSLVYGVMRWRGYLDWVITGFSRHPVSKMKSRTIQALRVGVFQLFFLDRIPPAAVLNETVQALKDMNQPRWLTGFVNGVLRNIERQRQSIPPPHSDSDKMPDNARWSHPDWLVRRWRDRYGKKAAAAICMANNSIAPLCLRVNSTLVTREALIDRLLEADLAPEPGKYSPMAVKLAGYNGPVTAIPGFAEGLFQVQDEAAQLVSMLLGPLQKGKSYLDGCAGLGGKTSHLAQMLPKDSKLFAVEPHGGRLEKLGENLTRLHLETAVHILAAELESLLPEMENDFSGILIDAPCSGLGVIRRQPDVRWNRQPDDLNRYRKIQSGMLACAARLLAPGGILVYITCSTEPEENREVIENFLASHRQFILSDSRDMLPANCQDFFEDSGCFQTIPGRDDLDGFFAARLIKR